MVQAGTQLGPYRLQRRIGSGGMAEVFLAQRIGAEGFSRTVAIKTILALGAEEEGIGLFLDEARVAASLQHAAIVQTLDLGYENETLFIVMEYIAGPSLSRILREMKKQERFLPWPMVAYLGARVASALDFAYNRATAQDGHLLRLIHRDISPQNIMLTRDGVVKLTDFGVARASIQTHKTRTGQVRGKAAYMAPEQVRAKTLDGRTDVFALGLVLYEALTSTRAYQRQTDIMSMRAILTDPVKPIREINPGVPPKVVEVVMRALEKSPDARYQSAGDFEQALKEAIRQSSEASIENDIKKLLVELFGTPDVYSVEDGPPVEAWQPTMAQAEAQEPQKLGGKLSPKIAELLKEPSASTPARPREASVLPETLAGSLTPDEPPASPSYYSPTGTPTPTPSGVEAPFSMPGVPGRSLTNYGSPSHAATVYTGLHAPQRSWLLKAGLPLLGGLFVALAFIGYQILTKEKPAKLATPTLAQPTAHPEAQGPSVQPGVAPAEPSPEPTPSRRPEAQVRTAAGEPPPRRTKDPSPREAPPGHDSDRGEERRPAVQPNLQKRAVAARNAAKERGDEDLQRRLSTLLIDLAQREPTEDDRRLVAEAERKLGI